jgi:hypothetical protein
LTRRDHAQCIQRLILEPLCKIVLKNCEDKTKMTKLLDSVKKQYKSLDNEQKLVKFFKEEDLYVEPETITVDEKNKVGLKKGISQVISKKNHRYKAAADTTAYQNFRAF